MPWPLSQDYNEAIQSPASSFADPDLRAGEPVMNALGMPMPRSGNFADVYEFIGGSGAKWALKCFTREVVGLQERYSEISKHLTRAKLPFIVDFNYLEQGICIRGQWYPVLKMQWVEGFLLNEFVRHHLDKPALLEGLGQIWLRMARRLHEARIAHADLQHGNVLLVSGSKASSLAVKLIDYDGMWVPALASKKSGEVGHPAYQHPQRLQQGTYSADVDRLPLLAVACALRCLVVGGKPLWDRYDNGDNLLFREADLQTPGKSALFKDLHELTDPHARLLVEELRKALGRKLEDVPAVHELLPETRPAPARAQASPPTVTSGELPATPRSPVDFAEASSPQSRREVGRSGIPMWALAAGGGVVAVAFAALLLLLFLRGDRHDPKNVSLIAHNPRGDEKEDSSTKIDEEPNKPKTVPPNFIPNKKDSPTSANLTGVSQQQINAAIEKGAAFLKKTQQPTGTWNSAYPVGHASLAGLTLLECMVPATDPNIQRAAKFVRDNVSDLSFTYEMSLAILFLDRLGETGDNSLIQGLSLRLLAGQQPSGGWTYHCPKFNVQEVSQLLNFLQSHAPRNGTAKPVGPIPPGSLPVHLQNLMVVKNLGKTKGQYTLQKVNCDNSNTQFALLALWAARRHDVPTDQTILAAHGHFSGSQNGDGGWGYMPRASSSLTMTCAGLLGLGMGHGVSPDFLILDPEKPNNAVIKPALQDPMIQRALGKLALNIGQPSADANASNSPMVNLYFLWGVERVALLYDLKTIEGKDWYSWGAQILIHKQLGAGNWADSLYHGANPSVNTCFALLFLRRSNLMQDLTNDLSVARVAGKR